MLNSPSLSPLLSQIREALLPAGPGGLHRAVPGPLRDGAPAERQQRRAGQARVPPLARPPHLRRQHGPLQGQRRG